MSALRRASSISPELPGEGAGRARRRRSAGRRGRRSAVSRAVRRPGRPSSGRFRASGPASRSARARAVAAHPGRWRSAFGFRGGVLGTARRRLRASPGRARSRAPDTGPAPARVGGDTASRRTARVRSSCGPGEGNRSPGSGQLSVPDTSSGSGWRSLGDSNPCLRRERAVSWTTRRRERFGGIGLRAPAPAARMIPSRSEMILDRRDIALDMASRLRFPARDVRRAARSPGSTSRSGFPQVSIAASSP